MELKPEAPRLQASWLRSEHYGVSLERVEAAFIGDLDQGSLLYECGTEVITGLHGTLANEPVSLMVADRDGLVLSRLCNDSAILRSLDRVHLAPGFSYGERHAGTNGLGLSLADRAPALVRAREHYCSALQGYTCAAAPVMDPVTGDLAGSINLTTWSDASSQLLLALATAAASTTSALMLVRATGRRARPAPRGEIYRVQPARLDGGVLLDPCTSLAWRDAVRDAQEALRGGCLLTVVGEPGAGKRALVQLARHGVVRHDRVLTTRPPSGDEVEAWLALWTPELRTGACVILSEVGALPAWAADELARTYAAVRPPSGAPTPMVLTAGTYDDVPGPLAGLVDAVVEAPPLRLRSEDVLPLAHQFARQERRRDVEITSAAARALTGYVWPGNVAQLRNAVREAAARADVIDVRHLPPDILTGAGHRLSRLEILERDEIVRCLTEPGATAVGAAAKLGIARATLYRKIAQYDIRVPRA